MKILFFGDIFGRPGRRGLKQFLDENRQKLQPDLVIANVDNCASGKGPNLNTYEEIRQMGVDVLTCGDHVWDQKEVQNVMSLNDCRLVRPINYPKVCPGKGYISIDVNGSNVAIVSALGRVWTSEGLDSPFQALDDLLSEIKERVVIVDFHAEATSEKNAFGHFLAGRVSAVLGTHTHVQTSDDRILDGHTAYISDVGFCGPQDSVIGVKKTQSIGRFVNAMPTTFDVADGPVLINGVLIEIDEKTGASLKIERICEVIES
jgi:metallophosphoesterase (TIGR00282 family)